MSEILKNFEADLAESYDDRFARLWPLKDALHLATHFVFQALPEDAHLLIVGAGTGSELLYLATEFPKWRFTAVDPSEDMLKVCKRKATQQEFVQRCHFHHGYVQELDSTPKFEAATSMLVSQFLLQREDRLNFFRNICDRLRPGGHLLTADLTHCGPDNENLWKVWRQAIAYIGSSPEEVDEYEKSVSDGVNLITDEQMRRLLIEAGFADPCLLFRAILINAWFARRPL